MASCSINRVPELVSLFFRYPVPSSFPGFGWGSGACLPTFLESCYIIISGFWLGFRGLSPYSFGILLHHPFLVPARVPGLVSALFWHPVPSSFPGSGWSSGACLRTLLASCSIIISWFRLGFRGLSPFFFGILFHHHSLVSARVPGLVSLLFWHPVPSSFPGFGQGSGACLPAFLSSCSIIISWFRLGFRGLSPYFFGILFHHHFLVQDGGCLPTLLASCCIILSWFRLGFQGLLPYSFGILFCLRTLLASCSIIISGFWLEFRGLSPYSFGILFHHHFLVSARVPGLVSFLFWHPVPSSFPGFGQGSGACLPAFLASCSIIISWFRPGFRGLSPCFFVILFHHHFLVSAGVPGLVSLLFWNPIPIILSWFRLGFRGLSPYSFGILFHHHVLVLARVPGLVSVSFGILFHHHSWFRLGFRGLSPYSSGTPFHHPFLVVASVPGLVAPTALELNGVLNSFKKQFCSTGIVGFRVFYSILAFCSIIISSILLFSGRVPGLSPQSSGILFHLHFLVPGRVPGVVSLVFWHSVPSSCRGSIWFQEGLWGLSPLCCGIVFHHDFLFPSCSC